MHTPSLTPDRKTYLTIARGDMECDMVDCVFEKGPTTNTSIKTIVEQFIQVTLGITVEKPTSTSPTPKMATPMRIYSTRPPM